jgi:hypothetical protein
VQIPVSAVIWILPDMATFAVISMVKLIIYCGLLKKKKTLRVEKNFRSSIKR